MPRSELGFIKNWDDETLTQSMAYISERFKKLRNEEFYLRKLDKNIKMAEFVNMFHNQRALLLSGEYHKIEQFQETKEEFFKWLNNFPNLCEELKEDLNFILRRLNILYEQREIDFQNSISNLIEENKQYQKEINFYKNLLRKVMKAENVKPPQANGREEDVIAGEKEELPEEIEDDL